MARVAERKVACLFVRSDSLYKNMGDDDEIECFDADRDALTFECDREGGVPVVAHPPCRGWGSLAHMSNATEEEKRLAFFAIDCVRNNGGVLEHPAHSKLFSVCHLPKPGEQPDRFGGFTIEINQWEMGHVAHKVTWLYVCGCTRGALPAIPLHDRHTKKPRLAKSIAGESFRGGIKGTKGCTIKEREGTPLELAQWLVATARVCSPRARDQLPSKLFTKCLKDTPPITSFFAPR